MSGWDSRLVEFSAHSNSGLGSKGLPIEIKAGSSSTLKSLNLFLDSHRQSLLGIRLYSGSHLRDDRILHPPLYTAGCLHRLRF